MIACPMPAAQASSTAYWITGLSTSGSISFGWALVAGRKRVPHPAAGKTAFRTRIEPHGIRVWAGRASIAAVSRMAGRGSLAGVGASVGKRLGEPPDSRGECRGPVEIGEGCGARQPDAPGVVGRGGERRREQPERQVVFAVEDERRA